MVTYPQSTRKSETTQETLSTPALSPPTGARIMNSDPHTDPEQEKPTMNNDIDQWGKSTAVPMGRRTFADLVAQADVIDGHDLERDKAALLGVPFCVTGIVYRDGVSQDKGARKTNYVSVELRTGSRDMILAKLARKALVNTAGDPITVPLVEPDSDLVINDGSTGIARQLTQYLHDKGIIDVGPIGDVGGAMGESSFDRYRMNWVRGQEVDGSDVRFDVLLMCPRGLRASVYEAAATGADATTYYLA